jgi:hypothetical protein
VGKIAEHEEAAHEQRNWVRLTFDCNDRCVFCLDAHTHDGTVRAREEIKAQILDGRRKGAQRLILSGGEPTIHPDFVDFVRLGRMAGYRKVQTVTNGRMFAYPEFLKKSLDAGLVGDHVLDPRAQRQDPRRARRHEGGVRGGGQGAEAGAGRRAADHQHRRVREPREREAPGGAAGDVHRDGGPRVRPAARDPVRAGVHGGQGDAVL